MGWVRQYISEDHTCPVPPDGKGRLRDLWRCDGCSKLWVCVLACAHCRNGHGSKPHAHEVGFAWGEPGMRTRIKARFIELWEEIVYEW